MKRIAVALLLAANGAWADPGGDFLRAVSLDDVATLTKLLAAKQVDPNLVDPQRGENGLILALRDDAMRSFRVLLEQPGIRIDQPAANGNTALMMAAFKGNKQAVLVLIAHGAAINKPGWTPLHYAAAAGELEIATLLLDRQAAIDAPSPSGITPLMLAAREGKDEAVKLLLARGADTRLVNNEKLTAEQIAIRADKPRIAALIAARPK